MNGLIAYLSTFYAVLSFILMTTGLLGMTEAGVLEATSESFQATATLRQNASATLFYGVLQLVFSVCLLIAMTGRDWQMSRAQAFLFLVLLWLLTPAILMFHASSLGGLDLSSAYFEMASAFTTTGATVIKRIDAVPEAFIFLRSVVQWLGGLMTLVGIVLIIAPNGVGGLPQRHLFVFDRTVEKSAQRVFRVLFVVMAGYAALTFACMIALILSGVGAWHSFNLALTTAASGGMSPIEEGVAKIGTTSTSIVLIVFMILAGSSIIWQRLVIERRWIALSAHRETYYFIAVAVGIGFIFAAIFFHRAGSANVLAPGRALLEGIFTGVSLVSTTGLEIREGSFAVIPATMAIMIVVVGGCSFSTAGGVTLYRLGVMAQQANFELSKLVYPNSVRPSHIGGQVYDIQLFKAVWVFFFVYFSLLGFSIVALAMTTGHFEQAIIAAVAALSNIGNLYATGWAGTSTWLHFGDMSAENHIILSALMILGRLHVLSFLGALSTTYWLKSQ